MIKTISLKCPECNANLSVDGDLKQCFCQYCGTKILIDDGSTTHTYRQVDEARLKEAEVQQLLELKKLEIAEQKRLDKKKRLKTLALVTLGLVVAAYIFAEHLDSFGMAAICGYAAFMTGIATLGSLDLK